MKPSVFIPVYVLLHWRSGRSWTVSTFCGVDTEIDLPNLLSVSEDLPVLKDVTQFFTVAYEAWTSPSVFVNLLPRSTFKNKYLMIHLYLVLSSIFTILVDMTFLKFYHPHPQVSHWQFNKVAVLRLLVAAVTEVCFMQLELPRLTRYQYTPVGMSSNVCTYFWAMSFKSYILLCSPPCFKIYLSCCFFILLVTISMWLYVGQTGLCSFN